MPSDLTPEEQRAVEAAVANWADACTDKVEREVYARVRAEGYGDESAHAASQHAAGYLDGDRDGYRRGVEAAANRCVDEGVLWMATEIRALLAQEEQS